MCVVVKNHTYQNIPNTLINTPPLPLKDV